MPDYHFEVDYVSAIARLMCLPAAAVLAYFGVNDYDEGSNTNLIPSRLRVATTSCWLQTTAVLIHTYLGT
jgi:hypothetical protein